MNILFEISTHYLENVLFLNKMQKLFNISFTLLRETPITYWNTYGSIESYLILSTLPSFILPTLGFLHHFKVVEDYFWLWEDTNGHSKLPNWLQFTWVLCLFWQFLSFIHIIPLSFPLTQFSMTSVIMTSVVKHHFFLFPIFGTNKGILFNQ